MEPIISLIAVIIMLILVWTIWQLNRISEQLNMYSDYAGEVREKIINEVVSPELVSQLRNSAQLELTNTVKQMNVQLQSALKETYQQLLQNIEIEAAKIMNGELEQYRETIGSAQQAAINVTTEAERELASIKKSIDSQVQTAVRAEKKQLLQNLDNKCSDIISHYLLGALGENVDLGSQKDYILRKLEDNLEAIKKDINDEF